MSAEAENTTGMALDPHKKVADGQCLVLGCANAFAGKEEGSASTDPLCEDHLSQARAEAEAADRGAQKDICPSPELHDSRRCGHFSEDGPDSGPAPGPTPPKKLGDRELLMLERAERQLRETQMAVKMAELSYKNACLKLENVQVEFELRCTRLGIDVSRDFSVDDDGVVHYAEAAEEKERGLRDVLQSRSRSQAPR